jgi:hypothetical protein
MPAIKRLSKSNEIGSGFVYLISSGSSFETCTSLENGDKFLS